MDHHVHIGGGAILLVVLMIVAIVIAAFWAKASKRKTNLASRIADHDHEEAMWHRDHQQMPGPVQRAGFWRPADLASPRVAPPGAAYSAPAPMAPPSLGYPPMGYGQPNSGISAGEGFVGGLIAGDLLGGGLGGGRETVVENNYGIGDASQSNDSGGGSDGDFWGIDAGSGSSDSDSSSSGVDFDW